MSLLLTTAAVLGLASRKKRAPGESSYLLGCDVLGAELLETVKPSMAAPNQPLSLKTSFAISVVGGLTVAGLLGVGHLLTRGKK